MNLPRAFGQRASRSSLGRQVILPVQEFLRTEAVSGVALLLAALAALFWANAPFGGTYEDFWNTRLSLDLEIVTFDETLRHAVNDGLMVLFFFVVGLEIKRELIFGELSSRAQAALPIAAALGGMVVPAVLFLTFNFGDLTADGWGIVIATDIAFAVGILALLSRHVPSEARIFLLAVAIVDDIAAILVIAVFYSDDLSPRAFAVGAGVLAAVVVLRAAGVRNLFVYFVIGAVFWAAVFKSGVHATIAGVILAALAPARPPLSSDDFVPAARTLVDRVRSALGRGDQQTAGATLREIEDLTVETEAPLERLERTIHPISSFVVIPVFALANAGVEIGASTVPDVFSSSLGIGIVLGLVVGKPLGIFAASWLAARFSGVGLPSGLAWRHILGIGAVAGIGFTVSIFVTGLAFTSEAFVNEAKSAILVAFVISSVAGFLLLRFAARHRPDAA